MAGLSRRAFLKSLGASTLGLSFLGGITDSADASQKSPIDLGPYRLKFTRETTTICPYCAVGCGIIVHTQEGKVVYTEGDPDHPINEGSLCPKGLSISDLSFIVDKNNKRVPNPRRLTKVLYRAPRSDRWEEKPWDWALNKIAERVKATRDATFEIKDENGVVVNRTQAIAHLGSASIDNEENYLMHKLARALGIINIEHHARL
ncbi:molybdopterin oxidoreductase Fe4S4 region [Calderihabitans maritimus]|uniref:Molybdopterin oxidoreductase Fe4S4 region n=3 Tax=Calderihabitans maritimus TaxID=1246530 RepID=A0A1Z5HNI2_9FIRM|nr:molybdopterin oxidoreductase Fe4S4 region [Calderihabitans maritimus]